MMLKEGYLNNIFDFPIDEEHFSSEAIESELENFESEGILKNSNPFAELNYNFGDFLPKLFPQQNNSLTKQKIESPAKAAVQEEAGISYMQKYYPVKSASESFEDTSCSNVTKSISSSHSSKRTQEILFKIEKNETKQREKELQLLKQKSSRKDDSEDDGDDREDKLSRNRISAKKSRQKKRRPTSTLLRPNTSKWKLS